MLYDATSVNEYIYDYNGTSTLCRKHVKSMTRMTNDSYEMYGESIDVKRSRALSQCDS